ncbi:MAG: RraA family protein [Clostridia bacterium]|nr:RraA family protein [Clostridia bacterium]
MDFCKLRPSEIAEALGYYGALETDIRAMTDATFIFGAAKTAWGLPGDLSYIEPLLPTVRRGDIVVIDAGGKLNLSSLTNEMIEAFIAAGAGGIVLNGSLFQHAAFEIPVFAKGVHPRTVGNAGRCRINIPVVCGGVAICPGDYIIGNGEGLICVKPEEMNLLERLL